MDAELARAGVRVEVRIEGTPAALPAGLDLSAYRIVQEALTNVAKHAQATTCRIYLQRLTNTLLVTIEDDGIGFEPDAPRPPGALRGIGLLGIRERVMQLRGELRLESAPGRGTRLTVEVPATVRHVAESVVA